METITVIEFQKEMNRIEVIQNEVAKILKSNSLIRWIYLNKAKRLHLEAEKSMKILWSKELIADE